ncbi:ABC transporter ATP-binding protein [Roseomonas sp. E05]|uniref:ABC transporter ATP-binding protein n=1 Tax=Roseomonas sp. E05 TaxID=3046310 RepID=UPI0024BAC0E1|nr:ABC transporter ATP-binding protein [Roseomonas sp. E05]MDJ0388232.1 ABC transporter ATP-binding protein [Roseomonas sp. E05]
MTVPALEVIGLSVSFRTDRGPFRAVQGLSFTVPAGRTLAIVGESGCGKSATSLAIMGLLPGSAQVTGTIRLAGQEIAELPPDARRRLRGAEMAMIFQEPMTSLNPAFTAGEQVAEALRQHRGMGRKAAAEAAIAALEQVRIPEAARRARQYPHQLSGGMRQRVMIAIALACRPRLLIADEPTTALDVTVQAQILSLLAELKRETGTATVLITHDLGVVADQADEVVVMYAGQVIERAPAARLFAMPQHPYTVGLLGAAPRLEGGGGRLASIEGTVPDLAAPPPGCRFAPRCPFAIARCAEPVPLYEMVPGHVAACHRAPLEQILEGAA